METLTMLKLNDKHRKLKLLVAASIYALMIQS